MWNITNQQADPMEFILDDGTSVTAPGHQPVTVHRGVMTVEYHRLTYTRNGVWPFPNNEENLELNAFYPGAQNIHIQNPTTRTEAVYQST